MSKPKRLLPEDRKDAILLAAINLARIEGYQALTRDRVAQCAGVSRGLITYHFLSTDLLRQAVLQEAINAGDAKIIAAAIVAREPLALSAPLELRQAAAATLAA